MRPPITITNIDPNTGEGTNRWKVKVGKIYRWFSQAEWEKDGVSWINNPTLPPRKPGRPKNRPREKPTQTKNLPGEQIGGGAK